jgi:hypothetical protein
MHLAGPYISLNPVEITDLVESESLVWILVACTPMAAFQHLPQHLCCQNFLLPRRRVNPSNQLSCRDLDARTDTHWLFPLPAVTRASTLLG